MPKKGYKQTEEHKRRIQERWKQLHEELEAANAELRRQTSTAVFGMKEFQMGRPPTVPVVSKEKGKRHLSEEHKQKLSERAKELNYSERIKPYMGQGKKELTFAEKQTKKAEQKMQRQIAASKKRSAMRFARQCMVGVQGEAIRVQILQEIGSLDVYNKSIVLEVVDFLIELGFLEPYSTMPAETRKKMSQSARLRHARRKDEIVVLQERAKKHIEKHLLRNI